MASFTLSSAEASSVLFRASWLLSRSRPGEREKRQRAGNAGKGKERRETSAIFCAVGWLDLRFSGYG